MKIGAKKIASALGNAMRFMERTEMPNQRCNVIAVIEKNGNIVTIGINNMRHTHPVYYNGEYDKAVHAEFDAIRKTAKRTLIGSTMYIFRFTASGLGSSKPCQDCMNLIIENEIKRIVFFEEGRLHTVDVRQ